MVLNQNYDKKMLVTEPNSIYSKNIANIKQSIFDIGKLFAGQTPYDEDFTSLKKDVDIKSFKQ
jgi:hypothetical protein